MTCVKMRGMANFIVTAYTLRYLDTCERRIWLDHHGDPAQRDTVDTDRALIGLEHERAVGDAVFGPTEVVQAESWEDMVAATLDLMRQGAVGIKGAAFERSITVNGHNLTLRGRIDWLRRIAQPSLLGRWAYQPVEIKQRKDLNDADRLQLDLYLWFLEAVQGVEATGWFWMGRDVDNTPLYAVEHTYDPNGLFAAIARSTSVLAASPDAPPIFLASHCKACHWHSACTRTASETRALTLLPGLSQITWEHMRRAGLHTVDDVAALTAAELQRFKGVGKARARELLSSAQSITHSQPVLRSPLPPLVRQPGIMLDLETRLDGGEPWCFGWMEGNGQVQIAIVAPYFTGETLTLPDGHTIYIIPDSDAGWRLVAGAGFDCPVYHWGGFERQVLRATAPPDVIEVLEGRLHDLNRTFKNCFALPMRSTSIKKVALYFGFAWPEGTNAFSAWHDYTAWLLDNDRDRLARACAYNRADVEALDLIWRWMVRQ